MTSDHPPLLVSVNDVEIEGGCVLRSYSTLRQTIMLLLTALGYAVKDERPVCQLRMFAGVDDCRNALLDVRVLVDSSMC